MDPSKLIEWLKLSPRYLFVISLTSGFLLFGPGDILGKIGVIEFVEKYRTWLGVIFLFFTSLFLVSVIGLTIEYFRKKQNQWWFKRFQKKRLKKLTKLEKEILSYFIENKTRTQTLPINNGTVVELEKLKIIYRSSTVSERLVYFSYNIQPWAWDYLNKRPHLLEIQENDKSSLHN